MISISKTLLQLSMALMMALGLSFSAAEPAQAGNRDGRIFAGIVLGAIGSAIVASEIRRSERKRRARRRAARRARHNYNYSAYQPRRYRQNRCYRGPKRCSWVGRRQCWYNRYDERVCSGGRYKCWRERVCE